MDSPILRRSELSILEEIFKGLTSIVAADRGVAAQRLSGDAGTAETVGASLSTLSVCAPSDGAVPAMAPGESEN